MTDDCPHAHLADPVTGETPCARARRLAMTSVKHGNVGQAASILYGGFKTMAGLQSGEELVSSLEAVEAVNVWRGGAARPKKKKVAPASGAE